MRSSAGPSPRSSRLQGKHIVQRRSFNSKNLTEFPPLNILSKYTELSFNHNPITSFKTLPRLTFLTTLTLDYTKIESFDGAKFLPQLMNISMKETPIAGKKYFSEMCLIAFGNQIMKVNGKIISQRQHDFVNFNRPELAEHIISGWILTSTESPIRLMHVKTRKRKAIHIPNYQDDVEFNLANLHEVELQQHSSEYLGPGQIASQMSCQTTFSIMSGLSYISDDFTESGRYSRLEDESRLNSLLDELLTLSRKWNYIPPQKKKRTSDDQFFMNANIFAQVPISVVRNRRLLRAHNGPSDDIKRAVARESETPFADERKSYLLQKMEAINRAKEEQERQRMVEEMLARKRHEEEEEEEEEELENQRRNLKRVSMGHNDFEENQELNKELQNHHESLKLKLQRRRSAGTPTSKTQNLSEQNQEPQSAENNTLNEQSTPNHQGEDFDINQEHQNQSQNYGKDKVEGDKGVNEEIEDIYKHRRMATLSQFIMKPSSMKTEKTTPNFDLDQIMETTNNGIEMKRRKSLAPVLSNHGRSSSNFNSNSPSRPESRASNSSSPKLSRHNSKVMFGEDEIDNSDKVLSPSRSKSNEFNLRLKRSTTPPKLPIVKRPLRKSDTNDEDDFELFDGLAGNEEEDDELLRVFKEERKRILQQQKEFEEKMAEEKKNKAEEEKRRIEEENRKMEEERKKKAEEEKRRIEEENRKMAEEKKKKAEEEKRRIEEENRKLEEEKKKKAEEEKRRIEDEERKNKELEEKEKSEKEKLLKGNKDLEIKQAEAEIEKDLNLINDDDIDDLDENALNEIFKGSELDDEINDEDTLEADLRMEGYQEFLEKFPGKEDDDVLCQAYVDEYVKNHMKK